MVTESSTDLLTSKIIEAAIEVHRHLGPGLMESVYESCLAHELEMMNLQVLRQLSLPIHYKGKKLDFEYRIDLLVENSVVVEIKSVKELCQIHQAQLLSYLKLRGGGRGLLINFNVSLLKYGLRRFII